MNSKNQSKYLPSEDDFPKFSAKERIFYDIVSYFGLFNDADCKKTGVQRVICTPNIFFAIFVARYDRH